MLTIAPGPDNLFVLMQSMSHGKKAGVITALGLCSGITVHTMAAALGLSAILYQSAFAFQLIKWVGAGYLIYLAWQAFRESRESVKTQKVDRLPLPFLFKKGFIMNVVNPKVGLFFLAFLPQFINVEKGQIELQMIALGLIFMVQAIAIFTLIAVFAGLLAEKWLMHPLFHRTISKVKGILFLAIGIQFLFMKNSH